MWCAVLRPRVPPSCNFAVLQMSHGRNLLPAFTLPRSSRQIQQSILLLLKPQNFRSPSYTELQIPDKGVGGNRVRMLMFFRPLGQEPVLPSHSLAPRPEHLLTWQWQGCAAVAGTVQGHPSCFFKGTVAMEIR